MKAKFYRVLIGLLIGGMLICPALASSTFPDVDEGAEYAEAVEYLDGIGIMQGDERGNFNPNATVTRAEMAAIICRMLGETEGLTSSSRFPDVPTNHWANAYISKAAELGIVNGYSNGLFGPSDNVTYEQAVAMILRTADWDVDVEAFGGYPDGYLFVAGEYGLLKGVVSEIGSPIFRAYIAIMIYNYYNPSFLYT